MREVKHYVFNAKNKESRCILRIEKNQYESPNSFVRRKERKERKERPYTFKSRNFFF